MQQIEAYMQRSREERRSHLRLSEPCDVRGGDSKQFKGLLAHYLDTTIPRGHQVYLCHACNNSGCSKVTHLYWGTPADNVQDSKEFGTWSSIYDRTVKKYGEEYANQVRRASLEKSRYKNPGYTQEQIDEYSKTIVACNPEKRGWVSRSAKALGISHTQVRRFIDKHLVR